MDREHEVAELLLPGQVMMVPRGYAPLVGSCLGCGRALVWLVPVIDPLLRRAVICRDCDGVMPRT